MRLDQSRVLFIDDDPDTCTLIGEWLQEAGYVCDIATNGSQALALARIAAYDIVLMDWHLPGLAGLNLLQALRLVSGSKATKFLVATGDTSILDARQESIEKTLIKPFSSDDLSAALSAAIRTVAA